MGASPATSHDVLLSSSHHSHHDSYSSPHQALTTLRISCIHDNDTDTETDERDSSVRMSSNSSISSYIYESPDASPRSSRSIQQDEISPHSRARHVMSPTSMSSSYCMTPGSSTPSSRRPSDGQDTHPSPSTSVSTLVSSTSACSLSSLRHTYICENPDCGGHCASTSGGACTCECACTCICTSCLFPALHPRYVVQATLQESLFGSVKLAYDTHIQSHVAIKMSERQLLEDNLTLAGHTVIEDVEKEVAVMSLLQATSTLKHATPLHSQRTLFTFAQQTLLGTYAEDEEEQQEEKKTRTSNIPQASPHPTLARSLLPQSLRSRRNSITSQPKASFASLLSLGVKHVVPLVDVIIDNDYHYLVTPYYDQSDLYEYISERSTKQTEVTPLVNKEAHSMFKQLISAVAYMHSRGVVHRDLSLENILLSTTPNKTDVPTLHVIDFGVAAIHPTITNPTLPDNPPFHTFPMVPGTHRPGKLLYMCPELFNYQTYDAYSNDLFSCGVILYCMLLGRPPFVSCEDEWAQYIMSGQWLQHILTYQRHYGTESQWIYDPHWSDIYEHIDVEAIDLLQCLLCPQERRYNIHQIIASPWFNKYT